MKLIGLTGAHQGREFPVPQSGLTVGRGSDNDVVLESDRQASRYHARFELADGSLLVRDRESVNGVFVNGQRIQGTATLAEGDEITIGQRSFRAALAGSAPAAAAPAPGAVHADETPLVVFKTAAPPDAGPIPVTFTPMPVEGVPPLGQPPGTAAEAEAKRRRLIRLSALGGGLFLLLLICGLLLSGPAPKKPAGTPAGTPANGTGAAPAPDDALRSLRVTYESLKAAPGVLFRYELQIRGNTVSILVDDPLNNRCAEDSRRVTPEQLRPLAELLLSDKVQGIASPARENATGESMRTRLSVLCGNRGNEILVENSRPPAGFREVEESIQNFAQALFGFGVEPMPYEEAMRLAEENYLNARRLYDEQNIDSANLCAAVKEYTLVLARLKNYDRKPAWYAECQTRADGAQKEFDAKVTKLRRDAQTLRSAGRLPEARQTLKQLLEVFANNWEGNSDATWAHEALVRIDIELAQKKNRNR